jgi:predicted nucleic acid-binding protein
MRILVDTNILVRAVERRHPLMRMARQALRSLVQQGNELCVAPQNIAEFWNVCTRPVEVNGLGNSIAATDRLAARIETFFTLLPDSMETFQHWRRLIVLYEVKGAKVHDARLIAIMQTYGLQQLLTFNAVDFSRYAGIQVIDPASVVSAEQ